jgi:predicted DNA-binding transcriptional regulator AlpA
MDDVPKKYSQMAADVHGQMQKTMDENKKASQSLYGFKNPKGGFVPFLTPKELSKQISVSVKTLERWRKEKVGPPFVKIGNKRIRYHIKDIDAWVQENMVQTQVNE